MFKTATVAKTLTVIRVLLFRLPMNSEGRSIMNVKNAMMKLILKTLRIISASKKLRMTKI